MWYAVQVETGREDASRDLIEQAARAADLEGAFEELFVPKRRTLYKRSGELVEGEEPLFPGYLIAVAKPRDAEGVAAALRRAPRFARLLAYDGVFTPLAADEVAWICAFARREGPRRVVDMSEGHVEGGRVVVTSGPLVGREGLIRKIDRRKRTAYLRLRICGREVETKVGLSLVRKKG